MAPMTMSEADLLAFCIDAAHLHGWMVWHARPARTAHGWRTPGQGDHGFPDLVLARGGVVKLREAKTDRGRLGPGQQQWLDALGEYGGIWRPRDWESIHAELRGAA